MINDKDYVAIKYKKTEEVDNSHSITVEKIIFFNLEEKIYRKGFANNIYNAKMSYNKFRITCEKLDFIKVRKLKESETLEMFLTDNVSADNSNVEYAATIWDMYKLIGYNLKYRKWN